MRLPVVLDIAAADIAATAAAAVLSRVRWRDNSDWLTTATTTAHRVDMAGCNIASSDAQGEMAVRNSSANSGECGPRHLAPRDGEHTLEVGPREDSLPSVKSRSEGRTSLRGDFTDPIFHRNSAGATMREQPKPRFTNGGFGRPRPLAGRS